MKIFIPFLLVGFCFCTGSANKSPAPKQRSGSAVIELFTSEGCSSCPPADRLLATVKHEFGDSNVLVMAYHVDYWDRLGWKDQFSSAANTDRQNFYARMFKETSIYTPQAVVNGATQFIGSDRDKILDAIHQSSVRSSDFKIQAKAEAGKVLVSVIDAVLQTHESIVIALVQKHGSTMVKRGENAGKELSHVNIVREFSILSSKDKTVSFLLPENYKANFFVAALIQNQQTGNISGYNSSAIN
jgi:hypothetical protein